MAAEFCANTGNQALSAVFPSTAASASSLNSSASASIVTVDVLLKAVATERMQQYVPARERDCNSPALTMHACAHRASSAPAAAEEAPSWPIADDADAGSAVSSCSACGSLLARSATICLVCGIAVSKPPRYMLLRVIILYRLCHGSACRFGR